MIGLLQYCGPAEKGQTIMMVHLLRVLFLVVAMAITVSYAFQGAVLRQGPDFATGYLPALGAEFDRALDALRDAGAELVDIDEFPEFPAVSSNECRATVNRQRTCLSRSRILQQVGARRR